jgi:hypothetical protein
MGEVFMKKLLLGLTISGALLVTPFLINDLQASENRNSASGNELAWWGNRGWGWRGSYWRNNYWRNNYYYSNPYWYGGYYYYSPYYYWYY